MSKPNWRTPMGSLIVAAGLLFLVFPFTRAVDPVDFLESLRDDEETPRDSSSTEYPNGVNVIPGEAEVNYPVYSRIPKSSFSCIGRPVGFYADTELRCQVWHICDEDRRQQSFLCTNGTVYSQEKRVCDWWYNVNCDPNEVSKNYLQNLDLYKDQPPKSEDNNTNNNNDNNNNKNRNNEFDSETTTRAPFYSQQPNQRRTPEPKQQQPYANNDDNRQYNGNNRNNNGQYNGNNNGQYNGGNNNGQYNGNNNGQYNRNNNNGQYNKNNDRQLNGNNDQYNTNNDRQSDGNYDPAFNNDKQSDSNQQYTKPSFDKQPQEASPSIFSNNYQPPTARRQPPLPQSPATTTYRPSTTTTYRSTYTTYKPTTTYRPPPPPAALESNEFNSNQNQYRPHQQPEQERSQQQHQQQHQRPQQQQPQQHQRPQQPQQHQRPQQPQQHQRPQQQQLQQHQRPQQQQPQQHQRSQQQPQQSQQPQQQQSQQPQRPQQQQSQRPQQTQQQAGKTPPSIQHKNSNGKRIVEIRVPLSQIPPEILAKYGKRIPEHLLKEIFLNFTRGMQQDLQHEAISNAGHSLPSGNNRSSPPKAPIPQNPHGNTPNKPVNFASESSPRPSNPSGNSNFPPPPPPPEGPYQKFRHSTPRKVDNVKFAAPTRELLDQYDDERQQVGESQNPIYALQQLYNPQNTRGSSKKSKGTSESTKVKDSFNFPSSTATPEISGIQNKHDFNKINNQPQGSFQELSKTQPPSQGAIQEFTRSQPRRRTNPLATKFTTTTTEEPVLITDRYVPVSSLEEKKNAEVRRIFLVAKQGIKVLPPIPVIPAGLETIIPLKKDVRHRAQVRTTTESARLPPTPKVSIPEDYYVKNERFQEAESRYPRPEAPPAYVEPQVRQSRRPITTTPVTTIPPTTTILPIPQYNEPEFKRTKPTKTQSKKKALPPQDSKKQDSSDYEESPQDEQVNQDEIELLRLAQEYIDLTGQDFGVRQQPKNA